MHILERVCFLASMLSKKSERRFQATLAGAVSQLLFGPVESRRLGRSVGINLFPVEKQCHLNCIYCECDPYISKSKASGRATFTSLEIIELLRTYSLDWKTVDALTLAGNGEPTMYKDLPNLYELLVQFRSSVQSDFKIVLLTNGLMLNQSLVDAFNSQNDVIQVKLDAGSADLYTCIDGVSESAFKKVVRSLKMMGPQIEVQTMLLDGNYKGQSVSLFEADQHIKYIDLLRQIQPRSVHLYTLSRNTVTSSIRPVEREKLDELVLQLKEAGISAFAY